MVRWAEPKDVAETLACVFHTAIRKGESSYSEAQRAAWSPYQPDGASFATRLSDQKIAVYEREGAIIGFMTLAKLGYIDLVFVLPEHRGTGIFRALYDAIEAHTGTIGVERLWTHASLAAQPGFHAVGFLVIQHEAVEIAGQTLRRAEMEKRLT